PSVQITTFVILQTYPPSGPPTSRGGGSRESVERLASENPRPGTVARSCSVSLSPCVGCDEKGGDRTSPSVRLGVATVFLVEQTPCLPSSNALGNETSQTHTRFSASSAA